MRMPAKDLGLTTINSDDEVDDGVDIGDVHLAITVHVGTALIGVRVTLDDADNAIHIGNVHLAITVHVTIWQI